ncbi:glycosyltransferase family 4 protein [Thiospirillum jenense]|uniref:Glycosyltransferase family 4 protein n=1 Tax=Thiospirillum jenense TaxID=1653858 RepID=A0A839HEC9_9GAMM|nr:glycosyltransferase family 4 protein [Thiospirillum jenense]MBB1127011.1 glycosyltransferase family 4 protein [Thiospirillum jenense]
MHILHIEGGSQLYGGALQVLYLLNGLTALGIDNTLICRPDCALVNRAASCATVCPLPLHGDLDVGMIPRLLRQIRHSQPELVHLHSRIGVDVMGGIAANLLNLPVIHTRRVDNPEWYWLAAPKYRLHDRVIAISAGIAEVLRAHVPPERLRLVRSAVAASEYAQPCDRAAVLCQLNLPPDAQLIGIVAQLIPRKGHQVAIAALAQVLHAQPRWHLLCFGRGALETSLRNQIAAVGLAQQIHLCGFRDDLPNLLPCLDLLVHPALMEGLGIALLQAAAAGVPIVASRVGGIPEAVRDGVTGLLVPPGDVTALRCACAQLLTNPAQRQQLGQAGARLVREEFSVEAMVAGNLAVYRELLGCAAG